MMIALSTLAGILAALGLVRFARGRGSAGARCIYAAGLFVAAVVYLSFALAGQAEARWLALEGLGVALFGGIAWLGLRRWSAALALGWAAHVLWDVGLHRYGAGAAFTPPWYPWLCLGFDLVLAGAAVTLGRGPRAAPQPPAAPDSAADPRPT